MAHNEPDTNKSASYINGEGESLTYDANYFLAFNVDEEDQYDAKKYFFNECKNKVDTTPPTLFDPNSLYRAETAMLGNLVMMQKFYELPFTQDIHFGYRSSPFTKEDMDIDSLTTSFAAGKASFDQQFEDKIIKSK